MIIPSIMGQNGHEMPQTMVKFMTIKRPCQLKIGTCYLPLWGLNLEPLLLLTFSIPWKEFRVEIRNEASVLWEKTGRTSLQIDTFRFYEPKSLHFLLSRKALKSFITTSTLTIEERNAFWSTNGVAVLKAVSAGESKQDPVGTSARFMINLLLWTFTPFLVQNLFSSRLRSSKEKETRCTVGRKGSWVDKIIDVYCGILLIVHCWITEGEEGEWSFL